MSQTKQIAIALAYDSREEAQYRRRLADLNAQWQQDAEQETQRTDFTSGLPFSEDAPPEMYYPAVLVSPATIPNVLICQTA